MGRLPHISHAKVRMAWVEDPMICFPYVGIQSREKLGVKPIYIVKPITYALDEGNVLEGGRNGQLNHVSFYDVRSSFIASRAFVFHRDMASTAKRD